MRSYMYILYYSAAVVKVSWPPVPMYALRSSGDSEIESLQQLCCFCADRQTRLCASVSKQTILIGGTLFLLPASHLAVTGDLLCFPTQVSPFACPCLKANVIGGVCSCRHVRQQSSFFLQSIWQLSAWMENAACLLSVLEHLHFQPLLELGTVLQLCFGLPC